MIQPQHTRLSLLAALLLVTSLATSYLAVADPAVNDNGNGTKTITWDFSNPANYTSSNVAIAPNDLRLRSTPGLWSETSDADFNATGTPDPAVRITNGSLRLRGNEGNLVADGDFAQGTNWTRIDGPNGSVLARQNLGTGAFIHETGDNSTQFDSMDALTWGLAASPGATSVTALSPIKVEGAASIKDTITLLDSSMWGGMYNVTVTPWNFSPYNRLSIWLYTNFSGPGQVAAKLHLESGFNTWDSTAVALPTVWQRIEFNFIPFGTNLGAVSRIELRFSGAPAVGANVYVDDIRLLYHKSVDDTASFVQTISKTTTGNGQPGSVLLQWDYAALRISNASATRLNVTVTTGLGTSQGLILDLSSPTGWTTRLLDLSGLMAPAGTYAVNLSLRVAIDTFLPTNVTVRIDNVLLKAPDYASGVYTSNPLDAGGPAVWGQAGWTRLTEPETSVSVETRAGSTPAPGDPTWSPWRAHATPEAIGSPNDRYLQFQVFLQTTNSSRTPALLDIALDYSRYSSFGWVETLAFNPPEIVVAWRRFDAVASAPASTALVFEVSTTGTWVTVTPGADLTSFSGTSIQVRASPTTTNTSRSPQIVSMAVTYEYQGPLWTAVITPTTWSGTADAVNVSFASQGKDRWNHNVPFLPTWETTDPNGTISPSGLYTPGKVGTWVVRVRDPGGAILANATVSVSPGALARLALAPPSATSPAGSQIPFFATGYDADANEAALTATEWSSTAGTFVSVTPYAALLRLPGLPGIVTVTARHGAVVTTADVDVTTTGTPLISGTVPNQIHDEDSTWSLDLTGFAANQPDPSDTLGNLKWYLTGRGASLYTVWGENFTGNHLLVFGGQPDAFGSDEVLLWLEDATGARTSQKLWVNLTAVDDPPHFATIPYLPVKAGKPYTFDVEPYIRDVDTPPPRLNLTTDDPAHVSVAGLNLTLAYPVEDLGRRIYLRLSVSDDNTTARTVVIVDVTSNTPPHVRIPLPDLTLQEDEVRVHAFPQSLASYFADDDGDDLFFSYGQRDITVVIWNNSGFWQVDVRPNADWAGVEKVTFRAEDRDRAFAEYSILVTVTPVNDPPKLLWSGDVFVRFDIPYLLDLSAYIRDVDTPLETVTLEASPTRFIQIRGFSATLLYPRFLLGPNRTYDPPATFYVNDTAPGGSLRIFVHVSDNMPPILRRPLPDVTFDEDTTYAAYRLSDYFTDPDNASTPRFNVTGVHVLGDLQPDSTVMFRTAAPNWFGQEIVFIRAEDAQRAFAVSSVLVRVSPVNDRPVFVRQLEDRDLPGLRTVAIDLRGYVTDVDDAVENLTFTADSPYAAVFGYVLLLDVPAGAESLAITVTASDGRLSASQTFRVTTYHPSIWAQIYWPWSGVGAVVAAIFLLLVWELFLRFPHTLEDVFIIGREGRLIMHNTRRLRADRDEDILAGMLTAIMLFVRDSFREEHEDLKQFEFGDRKVLVERGVHCYIAAIFGGAAPPWARKDVAAFLKAIETKVGDRIASWSGDRDDIHDLKGMTEEFVRRRRYRRNGGWWPFRARAS